MVMFPTGRHYIVTRKEKFCRIIPLEFVFLLFPGDIEVITHYNRIQIRFCFGLGV